MGLFNRTDTPAFGAAAASFSLLAMVLSFGALVAVAQEDDGGGVIAGGTQVALTEFAITPEMINVAEGGSLTVTNNGTAAHNLVVEGHEDAVGTPDLNAGEAASLGVGDLEAGSYTVYCAISGHRDAGMEGTLHVGGGGGGEVAQETGSAGATAEELLASNADDDALMLEPVAKFLENFGEVGAETGPPILDPDSIEPDGTKVYTLTAAETDWEVEPGKTVKAWAYNGMVPGPTMQLEVGDKVRVNFVNELPQSSAIHWHGIETPIGADGVPLVTQDPVLPGETYVYEFTVRNPQVAMYHSHHHAEHQVPDGLFGPLLVGDVALPADVGPVTQEIPMVLNDAGVIGLSLNGKSFPITKPIVAKVGESVLIHYYNEGLSIHPMHLHGVPQLVVAKDGFPLPQPYFADTVNVAPGERYSVLVRPTEEHAPPVDSESPAYWAFHCHILTHAERHDGMFGMVTVFAVVR
ncbi:MAG TPA: multicopper oxidase domain-containing protein [Acidimicrobiia bacterium]|nr:multicopper oxidase domain-containing protein [Acidimicrobiia bacterium]